MIAIHSNGFFFEHRPFSSSRNVANVDGLINYVYGGNGSKFNQRPGSMSETNLLKYRPQKEGGSTVRPESALGLLQGMFRNLSHKQ